MGKKKGKSTKGVIKPWYSRYGEVHLYDLATGLIPKRVRNILAAYDRLDKRISAGPAASDWRHIEKNLADIEDAFATIETALVEGEDIKRWKEFPGLDGAVKQVRGIVKLLDSQVKQSPVASLNLTLPRFVDEPPLDNTTLVKSNPFATGANGEPLQKRTKDEVKVKVEVEDEDDIEEGEIVIKNEDEEEQGVPVYAGSPGRLPSPEPVELNHNPQGEPHQFVHRYTTGFGGYSNGPPAQWMPQSRSLQRFYSPNNWDGVPNLYWHTPHPVAYPQAVMPRYDPGFVGFAPAGMVVHAYPQFPYESNHSYQPSPAVPQHFGPTAPVHPGNLSGGFLPAPPPPPPNLAPDSPIQPPEPSPEPSVEKALPSSVMVTRPLEDERAKKRKLSGSPGSSSGSSRRLKRRFSAHAGTMSNADDNHHDHSKSPRSASGPPDFGTWFQEQVADSKKKLSQLERAFMPTANGHDA